MSDQLSKAQVLHEMLDVLVKGWGRKAVQDALAALYPNSSPRGVTKGQQKPELDRDSKAFLLVTSLSLPEERRSLLIDIAKAFDNGSAFPKNSDVKAFLAAHNSPAKELRSRDHAFRLMLPIFARMSEKGLVRVLSASRHSGPAELASISVAIKDTGNDIRGFQGGVSEPVRSKPS
jgi:hypothetical protein